MQSLITEEEKLRNTESLQSVVDHKVNVLDQRMEPVIDTKSNSKTTNTDGKDDGNSNNNRNKHEEHATDASLIVLSISWLALCTGLVMKHWELVTIFAAFVTSFVLATCLGMFPSSSSTSAAPAMAATIRHTIGIIMYTTALAALSLWENDGNNISSTRATITTTLGTFNITTPDFVALSIAAGYLAFDHWYTALHGYLRKTLCRVIEDAVTLSAMCTVLATCPANQLGQYRTTTTMWLAYQMIRLAVVGVRVPSTSPSSDRTPVSDKNELVVPPRPTTTIPIAPTKQTTTTTPDEVLWFVQGQAYDLREFVRRHPGGREALLLGQGRQDCTALVLSYHPFSLAQVQRTLAKYRVETTVNHGSRNTSTSSTANGKVITTIERDAFYEALCQRVQQELQSQGLDPWNHRAAHTGRVVYYTTIATLVLASGYAHAVRASIFGSLVFASSGWLIGALGHDAGHFAASRYAWCNELGVWGMSLLCNPVLWQHQHTYAHHSFTNEFDADPDLHHFTTLLRVHRRFTHAGIHQNQRYLPFVVLAYALVVFGECVWIPFGMLKEGTLYGMVTWTDRNRKAIGMYVHLLAYTGIVLIAPFWAATKWYHALASVVLHISTSGLLFGFFSQINHLNEASIETSSAAKDSWAARQVEASNNFYPDSTLWYYLSNGLNLQIEHHLFPGLNHCHLWRIAPVVQATCAEYGVMYKSWRTWGELWDATRAWLDKLAMTETAVDDHTTSKL